MKTIKSVLEQLVNQQFVVTQEDVDKIMPEIKSILDGARPVIIENDDKMWEYVDNLDKALGL